MAINELNWVEIIKKRGQASDKILRRIKIFEHLDVKKGFRQKKKN